MAAQLQLLSVIDGELRDSSVVITETTPIDSKICLSFIGSPSEQKPKCTLSLSDAEFWFDATGDSAGSEGFPSGPLAVVFAREIIKRIDAPAGRTLCMRLHT